MRKIRSQLAALRDSRRARSAARDEHEQRIRAEQLGLQVARAQTWCEPRPGQIGLPSDG